MTTVAKAACQAHDTVASEAALRALAVIGTSFPELTFRHSMQVRAARTCPSTRPLRPVRYTGSESACRSVRCCA